MSEIRITDLWLSFSCNNSVWHTNIGQPLHCLNQHKNTNTYCTCISWYQFSVCTQLSICIRRTLSTAYNNAKILLEMTLSGTNTHSSPNISISFHCFEMTIKEFKILHILHMYLCSNLHRSWCHISCFSLSWVTQTQSSLSLAVCGSYIFHFILSKAELDGMTCQPYNNNVALKSSNTIAVPKIHFIIGWGVSILSVLMMCFLNLYMGFRFISMNNYCLKLGTYVLHIWVLFW